MHAQPPEPPAGALPVVQIQHPFFVEGEPIGKASVGQPARVFAVTVSGDGRIGFLGRSADRSRAVATAGIAAVVD
jgi:hypothetical protein